MVNQTFKTIEILCIDDCGSDNSIKIIEKYAAKDKRIKTIQLKNNKGLNSVWLNIEFFDNNKHRFLKDNYFNKYKPAQDNTYRYYSRQYK
ncbi:MAG: glycosyltransferase [Endomicrobium sp.]|nr:glycosyltransferase [Endomicrobium sp.]